MNKRIKVHCSTDNTSFLIDSVTLEPLTTSIYDPDVLENPSGYQIMAFHDWILRRNVERTGNE